MREEPGRSTTGEPEGEIASSKDRLKVSAEGVCDSAFLPSSAISPFDKKAQPGLGHATSHSHPLVLDQILWQEQDASQRRCSYDLPLT